MLNDKKEAIQIINSQLEHQQLKPSDIEHYNSSFISENLRNSEADIVYKLKNNDVYFLIEHQTYIDYSMPYRIFCYEKEILEAALMDKKIINKENYNFNNKSFKYPIIISIVLYTGHKKWKAELDLRKVQVKFDKYRGKEFSKYNVYDINTISNEELLRRKTKMNKIFVIEKAKTEKELEENIYKVLETKLSKEDKKFLANTIKLVFGKYLKEEKTKKILNKLKGDEKNMLAVIDMLDRRFAEVEEAGWKSGMEKGIKEGIKEGKKEEKIEIIKNMLKEKIPVNVIESVTQMDKKEIYKISKLI